jgi:hypothetical protein
MILEQDVGTQDYFLNMFEMLKDIKTLDLSGPRNNQA